MRFTAVIATSTLAGYAFALPLTTLPIKIGIPVVHCNGKTVTGISCPELAVTDSASDSSNTTASDTPELIDDSGMVEVKPVPLPIPIGEPTFEDDSGMVDATPAPVPLPVPVPHGMGFHGLQLTYTCPDGTMARNELACPDNSEDPTPVETSDSTTSSDNAASSANYSEDAPFNPWQAAECPEGQEWVFMMGTTLCGPKRNGSPTNVERDLAEEVESDSVGLANDQPVVSGLHFGPGSVVTLCADGTKVLVGSPCPEID